MSAIANLTELCEAFGPVFEQMGYPPPTAQDVLDMVLKEEQEKTARLNRILGATQNGRHERKLLRDERGSAYGEVKAEIPEDLLYHLRKDKRFGEAALNSPDGIKEIVKQFPSCGTKTVGTKSGYTKELGRSRVKFGNGTIKFAS